MDGSLLLVACLACCLFWTVGVYNRITRLRARSGDSFAAVALCLRRYRVLVLANIAPARLLETPLAFQHLVQLLERLDKMTAELQICPWDRTMLIQLNALGAEVAATWGVLCTAPADLAGAALPEHLMTVWGENSSLLRLGVAAFNQTLADYNDAISQFPASLITRFLGFKPAGVFALFHES